MKLAWLVLVIACKSSTSEPDPRSDDRDLECDETVTDMLRSSQFAVKSKSETRRALIAACERDIWSRSARACLAAAQTPEAQLACARRELSAGELRRFEKASAGASARTELAVTSISPSRGDTEGGTYVLLKGERFTSDGPRSAKVYFGSRQGTVVRFASDREVVVQSPPGPEGETVDVVVVFEPGGALQLTKAFTYVKK